jgi:hypothetical protein
MAALAAVWGVGHVASATPIDASQTLSHSLVSSKRSIEPLIDYRLFPWPYAYVHQIDRVDRFTNTSPDTVMTITQVTALAMDPQALGFADLTAANRADVEKAATVAHPTASFWGVDDLSFAARRVYWTSNSVRPEDGVGKSLSFPLTLAPHESALLHSVASTIGVLEDVGELIIGWEFVGTQTGSTPPLSGDVNRDGRVDLDDFGILKANFGAANANWSHGDLNGDGRVSLDDFGKFKESFGTSATAVPEPSSALLSVGGALVLVGICMRRPVQNAIVRLEPSAD